MNAALLRFLLRRHWLACLLCCVPPILIGALVGLLYPSYRDREEAFRSFLPLIQKLLGDDVLDLFSPSGFLNIPFTHPLTLVVFAVAAGIPAIALPAGERGRGALGLLLATGLGRRQMIGSLALFLVPVALVVGLAPLGGTAIGAWLSGVTEKLDIIPQVKVCAAACALVLWLGSAALVISVLSRDRTIAAGRYIAVVFLSLILQFTAQVWERGSWLIHCTPYGYYRPPQIVAGVASFGQDLTVLLVTATVLAALAVELESRARQA